MRRSPRVRLSLSSPLIASLWLKPSQLASTNSRCASSTTVGLRYRLSAQMAHDIKNPLAAIRGAAQFLDEEKKQGRSIDDHAQFVELILEQSDRLGRVVDAYQRLGRVEAVRAPLDLARLCHDVVGAQRAAARGEGIELACDVRGLPIGPFDGHAAWQVFRRRPKAKAKAPPKAKPAPPAPEVQVSEERQRELDENAERETAELIRKLTGKSGANNDR